MFARIAFTVLLTLSLFGQLPHASAQVGGPGGTDDNKTLTVTGFGESRFDSVAEGRAYTQLLLRKKILEDLLIPPKWIDWGPITISAKMIPGGYRYIITQRGRIRP